MRVTLSELRDELAASAASGGATARLLELSREVASHATARVFVGFLSLEDREDIGSETVLVVVRQWHRIRREDAFQWLWTVAVNRARDLVRARYRTRNVLDQVRMEAAR